MMFEWNKVAELERKSAQKIDKSVQVHTEHGAKY